MNSDKFHIFYTDDDVDDIDFFRDALNETRLELELVTQKNGGELLQQLENPPPHPSLLLLDWNMPGKDGEYVLRAIRANDKVRHIPVVVFTTSDNIDHVNKARELGASLFATKPNSFQRLVEMIRKLAAIDWKNFQPEKEKFVFSAA
jgi:CheY-like chemotaxis protein